MTLRMIVKSATGAIAACGDMSCERAGEPVVFSGYIIGYLFCAGTGAGAFFVAAGTCVWDAIRQTSSTQRGVEAVQAGFLAAPVLMLIACALLLTDLGVPERAWAVVAMPFQSVMSVGAWLVGLLTLLSGAMAAALLVLPSMPRGVRWAGCVCGLALATGVMAYTGLLLSDMVSVDFWHTPWLVMLFVVSSLSCGMAVDLGLRAMIISRADQVPLGLWRLAGVLSVAEAIALVGMLVAQSGYTAVAHESCMKLLSGELAPMFWALTCGAGLAFPLAVHVAARRPRASVMLAASVGVLAGGVSLRYCVVAAALFAPLALGAL